MKRLFVPSLVLIVWLVSLSSSAAQTLRVIANDAPVRLQPDPNSTVIATVKAGTVLDTKGKQGNWYLVALSDDGGTSVLRAGYVAITDVEEFRATTSPGVRPARSPVNPPPASFNPPASPTASSDWQARYDRAQARHASGWKKFWIATALGGAGAVMIGYYSYQGGKAASAGITCIDNTCYAAPLPSESIAAAGSLLLVGGGVFSVWSAVDWIKSRSELQRLEFEKLGAGPSASRLSIPLVGDEDSGLQIVASAKSAVGFEYRLAW